MALAAPRATELALVATGLDPAFYLDTYPDVTAAGIDPVLHYVQAGWREGRDPAPWFSTAAYLADNPDIAALGLNPFAHFLQVGALEARVTAPSDAGPRHLRRRARTGEGAWRHHLPPAPRKVAPPAVSHAAEVRPDALSPDLRQAVAAEFDATFYAGENPDVARSGMDPLDHFLRTGWREGRDPTPRFSVADYLEMNPDVAAAGMNPFVHYVQGGRAEGRATRWDLGFRHGVVARLRSLPEREEAARQRREPVVLGDADALRRALARSRSDLARLHLTVSHDDYTANLGGVQLCLQREAAAALAEGVDHLHLYPSDSRALLRRSGEDVSVGVIWNGEVLGAFGVSDLCAVLSEAVSGSEAEARRLVVHSLLGHGVDEVLSVAAAAGIVGGWFWVHDFAAACASYHLLRNDVVDCGAPPPESQACRLCVYGEARAFHMAEHRRLFEALELSVAAPSAVALETWLRGSQIIPRHSVVAPLAELVPQAQNAAVDAADEGPLRVAFPGLPGTLKGWPVFRELALRFGEDPRYRFLHLARDPSGLPGVEFHPVAVSAAHPQAMRETIEAQGVDAVLIWSLCRETFSFTTHEAAAAGAAVLTGPDSGNVAAFVQSSGLGQVLANEAALFELFESGAVLELSRARRKAQTFDLSFSRLTFDLPPEGAVS
ncbi:MAG: hypothetical protein AB1760_04465 [Pseudomonadota bacterium]